ncbi:MAG: hypothetical protein KDI83_11020 [Gammaproteobacteria bacterium]|nr:hypothetical protein [Gammaproteobacteria bacterium]
MKTHSKHQVIRLRIAEEAARMLANQESSDFQSARRKAATRLGCRDQRCFPDNAEIDNALRAYQQLFKSDSQPDTLRHLRRQAIEAMQQLHRFSPRLTGAVLHGTAHKNTPVQLYLFADTPEQLLLFLLERRIPFTQAEIKIKHCDGSSKNHPLFAFQAGGTDFQLILMSSQDRANPPLDPRLDRPGPGVGLSQARALLEE